MKKLMMAVLALLVVLLPRMVEGQEPSDNGTVPPYVVWLPVVYSQQPWPCLAELWAEPVFPEEGHVVPKVVLL